MARRGILSHKLRKFFRKANLASNASGAPNCPFHKSGKQGIWRAICEKSSAALRLFRLVEAPAPIPKHAEFFCGYAPFRCCFLKTAHVEKHKKNENTLQSLRNYAIIQKYLTEGRHQLCLQQYPRKPAI